MNLDINKLNKLNLKEFRLLESGSLSNINLKSYDLDSALKMFDKILENNLNLIKGFKTALLFSGGIDSTILAYKMIKLDIDFTPIIVAAEKEPDYKNAIQSSKTLGIDPIKIKFDMEEFEQIIPEIMKLIDDVEEKQVNIAAPFTLAAKFLKKDQYNVAILGQAADELFGGYQRYVDFLKENQNGFQDFHLKDIQESVLQNYRRDNAIFSKNNVKLYLPYFTESILEIALSLPAILLVDYQEEPPIKKRFLREYAKRIGIPRNIYDRKKIAIQFGSGSYKILRKIALKYEFTKDLANSFGYRRNVQLYLDYIAQKNEISDAKLDINQIETALKS